jgi:hypothetical protein
MDSSANKDVQITKTGLWRNLGDRSTIAECNHPRRFALGYVKSDRNAHVAALVRICEAHTFGLGRYCSG